MPAMSLSAKRGLELAARGILAAVLIGAGIPKLLDPAEFAEAIGNYQLIPDTWAGPLAVFLPPLELMIAGALIIGIGAALLSNG